MKWTVEKISVTAAEITSSLVMSNDEAGMLISMQLSSAFLVFPNGLQLERKTVMYLLHDVFTVY